MNLDRTIEVPLCDIQASYFQLRESIDDAVARVFGSGQVILGPEVAAFEREVAAYCGVAHGVGCGFRLRRAVAGVVRLENQARRRSDHAAVHLFRHGRAQFAASAPGRSSPTSIR